MKEVVAEIEIGVEQERSLTPRREDRRYHSPNLILGTRNRSTSRVKMKRDRIRCYKCREMTTLLMNSQTHDDSDGYDLDRAVLQLITAEAEIHENCDATWLNEEQTYLNYKG